MRWIAAMLLALMLCAPALTEGETAMPVDAFVEKAGIEADAALRDKIADFLKEKSYSARIIGLMDPALAKRYAEHLAADLPVSYEGLLEEPAVPLPEDADFGALRELAVLHPHGAVTASLLADFGRGLLYCDEAWPVPADVCRAGYAAPLTPEAAAALMDILDRAHLRDWPRDFPGDPTHGLNILALRFDTGVTRYTIPAISIAPKEALDAVMEILGVRNEE